MNKLIFSTLIFSLAFVMVSCDDEDDNTPDPLVFDYHAHVHTPNTDAKHVNDTIALDIVFESHTGQPVHHVNIRIYSKNDGTEVYNKPDVAHVHETDGKFEFSDSFVLSNDNGVTEHTDWILEAKVWGHEAGLEEVVEKVEFHVHPE